MSGRKFEPEEEQETLSGDISPEDTEPSPTEAVEVGTLQNGDSFLMEGKVYDVGRISGESVEALEMTEATVAAARTNKNVVSETKVIRYAVARADLPPDTRVNRL